MNTPSSSGWSLATKTGLLRLWKMNGFTAFFVSSRYHAVGLAARKGATTRSAESLYMFDEPSAERSARSISSAALSSWGGTTRR